MQCSDRALLGAAVYIAVFLGGCEYRIPAQESYFLTLHEDERVEFVADLRSELTALGFSEHEGDAMSDDPLHQRLAFEGNPVRVDVFTDDGGIQWMFTCSATTENFTVPAKERCDAVAALLMRFPGEFSRVNSGG